ncbi:hypothetical protein [Thalassoglobus polymorphus]|uniref:Uncharacterized protein n=1 Tax=Thalassoglobus polymorphus TaxID=2527994 RepID=A0A517QPI2_9PLAN|nr:hypothetical protein [Thalassoglobus polymorphus]QDT33525.1 hypothetical protein Mal48_27780 [Thalassoglobus polymorphus]
MDDRQVELAQSSGQRGQLPEGTRRRLEEFQKRVRFIKIAEGLLAGLFGLAVSYLLVFVLDRFFDTPALLRAAILIVGALGMGLFLPLKLHRWIWGTRTMEQVAGLVRIKFPRLGDQLLGVVELAMSERHTTDSSALTQAAINQVDATVKDKDLLDAVPDPQHGFWLKVAAVPLALMLTCLVIVPAAGTNALTRWLTPWRNVDRYTFAQIDQLPSEIVVPHGEEFSLKAKLGEKTRWSPKTGTAKSSATRAAITTDLKDGEYEFLIPAQTTESHVNVRIGDVRESVRVQTATRPELKEMQASIQLPKYLQYSRNLKTDVRGGVISVVKGSEVDFAATINRILKEGAALGESSKIDGDQLFISEVSVADSGYLTLRWKDELGLTPKDDFKLKINAVDDAEPSVYCQQVDPRQVVLSTETISFELSASDDFGLKNVGLRWEGIQDALHNPDPDNGEKVVSVGQPEAVTLSATATFSAEADQVRPQALKIQAFAEDYHPERGRAFSPTYVLYVMSPQDHAIWLSNQLRRWASLADDVYEEEVRLHDANREIRRMSRDEIQSKQVQQQLKSQATAEKSNAMRLDAVTTQGEVLIQQAVRNPEMLVGHLETWAEALKQLRDISENRMPSVADLLNDAAQAKSTAKPKPGAGKPSKSDSAPKAGNNRNQASGKLGAKDEEEGPAVPKAPSITDVESGFNKPNEAEAGKPKKKKPSTGKLGLPSTVLNGGPKPEPKDDEEEEGADEQVDEAVELQAGLIDDFNKIREDLQAILDDLENSTFVKRFKAASRRQMEIAKSLNRTVFKGFGVTSDELDQRQIEQLANIAESEVAQSRNVWEIQSDLEAYFGRKKDEKFKRILDEMKELEPVAQLNELGERVQENLSGEAIVRAEFWADTLDRWGEELVSPSNCGACKGGNSVSLPPSIVLEVMRIIEAETDLREETRSLEQSRAAMEVDQYDTRAKLQSTTQSLLQKRTEDVVKDIRALPDGEKNFSKEIQIVTGAALAMNDATQILKRPDTGPEAIAAETEAIELLLQSKRANPNGGGGGGGSTPGGGGDGDTQRVALATIGATSDPNAKVKDRTVDQSSGTTSEKLPEEFRNGLDAFFNALENQN